MGPHQQQQQLHLACGDQLEDDDETKSCKCFRRNTEKSRSRQRVVRGCYFTRAGNDHASLSLLPAFAAPSVNKDQLNLNKGERERGKWRCREQEGGRERERGQVNATATTIVFLAKGAWHNKLQQVNAH